MEPPITIDYDQILYNKNRKILLVIEGDRYWFDDHQIEIDEEEFTVEMPYELARKKGFV
jgi:hypothetical protein